MQTTVFSLKDFEREYFETLNAEFQHELTCLETHLSESTALLARNSPAVCGFVTDDFSRPVLERLSAQGTRFIALRSAGYNNVDMKAAEELGFRVARVPAYSPYAVAEHAMGLMLSLNRKIHRAYNRVRERNMSIEGLMGFDMHGKTAGVVGTGKIGIAAARILNGMGCRLLGYDVFENPEALQLGLRYVDTATLFRESDIITLHAPLTPETYHMVNAQAIASMKPGVMLINTSRGGLVDSKALIAGLKQRIIGSLGLDVYEEEGDLFYEDLSTEILEDDVFARLLTFPNVLITSHQAFFTHEAVTSIVEVTLQNLAEYEATGRCRNEITREHIA